MDLMHQLIAKIGEIEEKLSYSFKNKEFLILAFVHRSFFNENKDKVKHHNERLEFLGDSVLGLLISDYLYSHLPSESEGLLSHLRAHIVEASSCAQFLNQLYVAEYVLLGRGERMNDGRGRETILADLFEALIGAIYLDGGIEAAKSFFFRHFSDKVKSCLLHPLRNWKAELQDHFQKKFQKPPTYKILKETGPDHSKFFQVGVYFEEMIVGEGAGGSKKEAEIAAAENALEKLRQHA